MKVNIFCCMLMIYSGVGFANPNDNPLAQIKGDFKLTLSERPNVPYQSLNNYNSSLTASGSGTDYIIPVSRHHIIPFGVLRSFYNKVAENNRLRSLSGFLNSFSSSLSFYAASNGANCASFGNDLIDAGNLAQGQAFGLTRAAALSSNAPLGFATFEEFYAWLPGNLFIGPTNRIDDPQSGFEVSSRTIVGEDTYTTLFRAYNNMQNYINTGDASLLNSISADLTNISKRKSIYPLQSEHWEVRKDAEGKYVYNIRKTSKSLNAISQVDNEALSEECSDMRPTLMKYLYLSVFPDNATNNGEL
ncbi:hypothetical protein [Aeromonas veronii]|uniref:hypothetical protein n=1 Tax=Aeromonas veronii TaxID=654 RepID=UPI00131570E8|nr:hypothetical protein [Aeromonas veronii]